jgi:hypothetical protein
VHKQAAVPQRLAADLEDATRDLLRGVGPAEPDVSGVMASGELVAALSGAAGVPVVLAAVSAEYTRRGRSMTGWPPARWLGVLRRDPVKKLHLGVDESAVKELARGWRPTTTPAQQAGVDAAVEKVTAAASKGLPARWAAAVRAAVPPWNGSDGGLGPALDEAVASVGLGRSRRAWFVLVGLVQWLALLALIGGLGWLAADYFADVQDPSLGEFPSGDPIPASAAVAVGGAVVGLLTTLLARWWVRSGSRRRRERAQEALTEAIEVVARERVVAPVTEVLAAHRRTREALSGNG